MSELLVLAGVYVCMFCVFVCSFIHVLFLPYLLYVCMCVYICVYIYTDACIFVNEP